MKNLILVNIITVLLIGLSIAVYGLFGFFPFVAALGAAIVYAVYANYNVLLKKEDTGQLLRKYHATIFQKEILRIERAKQSLLSRKDFFLESGNPRLVEAYREASSVVDGSFQEAGRFLSSYDFVSKPQTHRMEQIAAGCERAVSGLNSLTEEFLDAGGSDEAQEANVYLQKFKNRLEEGKQFGWDKALLGELSILVGCLGQICDELEKQGPGDYSRLFSYYLPTVEKLLGTAADVERQHMKGKNVRKTQEEIRSTLISARSAMEAMLDGSYEYVALDVSSEARVMDAMRQQDGLAEVRDFERVP